jgi:NAD(P)-dependent dehydrogenase (short-subunit alcohol dehydrogenase family)
VKVVDRAVVVTGAANGLGEAIARRVVADGGRVFLADLEADALGAVAADLGAPCLAADLTQAEDVLAVVEGARRELGDVDIWIGNAGMTGRAAPGVVPEDEAWELQWRLHVMANVIAARALLPSMVERGDGYLFFVVSSAALGTMPDRAPYTVTKTAALSFAEWLAIHHRPLGVKVSAFCPGGMRTRMLNVAKLPADSFAVTSSVSPAEAADIVVRGIDAEEFLVVTRPGDLEHVQARYDDWDEWIATRPRQLYQR